MLVDWHFVCSGWHVLSAEVITIRAYLLQAIISQLKIYLHLIYDKLTAVLFIRGAVVVAVVDAIAHVVLCNTAPVVAGELRVRVTRPEETALLIAVISAVVVVVTAIVVGHTSPIATGEHSGFAGVEGCQSESRTGQERESRQRAQPGRKWDDAWMQQTLILPDSAIKDDSTCGTACKDTSTLIHMLVLICVFT